MLEGRGIQTLKEEEVYLHEYQDFADARQHIGRFLEDLYMHKRVHSALGYLPPAEFEMRWRATKQPTMQAARERPAQYLRLLRPLPSLSP